MRLLLCCCWGVLMLTGTLHAQSDRDDVQSTSTVGVPQTMEDLILPGSELLAKPLVDDPPMVLQIIDAIPHGDSFRYKLRFTGMEPGKYDLTQWMTRSDPDETTPIPAVMVEIKSLLPPGQVTPNELSEGLLPWLGGYQLVAIVAVVAWLAILFFLIFSGGKRQAVETNHPQPATLAELLRQRLQPGQKLMPQQYAEIERMLLAFWRRRLALESIPLQESVRQIQQHDQAGPLMRQLEQWLHRPGVQSTDVDLAKLLEPYQHIDIDAIEGWEGVSK